MKDVDTANKSFYINMCKQCVVPVTRQSIQSNDVGEWFNFYFLSLRKLTFNWTSLSDGAG